MKKKLQKIWFLFIFLQIKFMEIWIIFLYTILFEIIKNPERNFKLYIIWKNGKNNQCYQRWSLVSKFWTCDNCIIYYISISISRLFIITYYTSKYNPHQPVVICKSIKCVWSLHFSSNENSDKGALIFTTSRINFKHIDSLLNLNVLNILILIKNV